MNGLNSNGSPDSVCRDCCTDEECTNTINLSHPMIEAFPAVKQPGKPCLYTYTPDHKRLRLLMDKKPVFSVSTIKLAQKNIFDCHVIEISRFFVFSVFNYFQTNVESVVFVSSLLTSKINKIYVRKFKFTIHASWLLNLDFSKKKKKSY
jgi:hypothetical protein